MFKIFKYKEEVNNLKENVKGLEESSNKFEDTLTLINDNMKELNENFIALKGHIDATNRNVERMAILNEMIIKELEAFKAKSEKWAGELN